MEQIVNALITKEAMSFQDEDAADVSQVMAEIGPIVEDKYPEDSPQRIFFGNNRRNTTS